MAGTGEAFGNSVGAYCATIHSTDPDQDL